MKAPFFLLLQSGKTLRWGETFFLFFLPDKIEKVAFNKQFLFYNNVVFQRNYVTLHTNISLLKIDEWGFSFMCFNRVADILDKDPEMP